MTGHINDCYEKAIDVLRKNSTHLGFSASNEKHVNYYSVWGRDHSITAIAAVLTKDAQLIETAKTGLLKLLQYQADNGQIPSYIEIENRKKNFGGLGSITSIDSNMWVVIASAILYKATKDKRFITANQEKRYSKVYYHLRSLDANACGLLETHLAGDWSDIFNRSYNVLYNQVLYYESLRSLDYLFSEIISNAKVKNPKTVKMIRFIRRRKRRVKKEVNRKFFFTKNNLQEIKEEYMISSYITPEMLQPFYQSHLTPFKHEWVQRFDSLANILAISTSIAPKERSLAILSYIKNHAINEPMIFTALFPPVLETDPDWEPIYATKEAPYHYHNGGIWPFIAGFYIASLMKLKKKKLAKKELEKFSLFMKNDSYSFNEYYHGKTLEPLGRPNQAWSAAGFIIGYVAVKNHYQIFV